MSKGKKLSWNNLEKKIHQGHFDLTLYFNLWKLLSKFAVKLNITMINNNVFLWRRTTRDNHTMTTCGANPLHNSKDQFFDTTPPNLQLLITSHLPTYTKTPSW